MPCERKSVEPMAAITAPHRTAAQHQSLLHFVGEGKWSDDKVMAKVREMVLPSLMAFLASPRLPRRPRNSGPPRSSAARSLAARSAAWRPAREQEPGA